MMWTQLLRVSLMAHNWFQPVCCGLPLLQAAWLYKATGKASYLTAAQGYLQRAQVGSAAAGCSAAEPCGTDDVSALSKLKPRRPACLPICLQYQRNYFVSWDSVYVAVDNLLLSMGVGPSPGVDSQWQLNTFLTTWQKGARRGAALLAGIASGIASAPSTSADGCACLPGTPRRIMQARTA